MDENEDQKQGEKAAEATATPTPPVDEMELNLPPPKPMFVGTMETDEDYSSIYKMTDVHAFIRLILQCYGSLTIYVIEPYIAQNPGEPLKIPATDNFSIYDYGGRLVITANDIYATSLFACSEFLKAIENAIQMILDAGASEIAILGDQRAKLFTWDRCDRIKTIENIPISVINFTPTDAFNLTREAVLKYLREHGLTPITRPKPAPAG